MAKITIEIDTHDADDIDTAILAALGGRPVITNGDTFRVADALRAENVRAAADALDRASGVAEETAEAPKRTRRTKAQIEADNAAQATSGASSTASDTSGPSAAETAPLAETASTPDTMTDEGAMTLQMVEDRIKHLMSQGVPAISLVGICKDKAGVSSARHADPSKLPAIWAALGELMS